MSSQKTGITIYNFAQLNKAMHVPMAANRRAAMPGFRSTAPWFVSLEMPVEGPKPPSPPVDGVKEVDVPGVLVNGVELEPAALRVAG